MMKLTLAIALVFATSSALAQPMELNRCQSDNTFAYWTPNACATGDRLTGVFNGRETNRNFTEHVKRAECIWRAMTSDRKLYPAPLPGTASRAPSHPECDYAATK